MQKKDHQESNSIGNKDVQVNQQDLSDEGNSEEQFADKEIYTAGSARVKALNSPYVGTEDERKFTAKMIPQFVSEACTQLHRLQPHHSKIWDEIMVLADTANGTVKELPFFEDCLQALMPLSREMSMQRLYDVLREYKYNQLAELISNKQQ